jgi:hypothetical protein
LRLRFLDDIRIHLPEGAEQIFHLPLADFEIIQRHDQIAYQCVEGPTANSHAAMNCFHVTASVFARAAAGSQI